MIKELMIEYNLEIDDIRWYLSVQFSRKLLEYKEDIPGLAQFIWSKKMETELYDMEETFIKTLEQDFIQKLIDESRVREIFSEIVLEKQKRFRNNR